MSLRKLPEIKAFHAPPKARWDIPSSALDKWSPSSKVEDAPGTISIFEGIGEQWDGSGVTTKRMAGILRSLGERDVIVSINSPGGDFFEGVSIYNLLRMHPAKVTVQVTGLAASAASIIAMAGDDIQIAESGFLMIHNSWSVVMGNRHDLRAAIDILEPFDEAMVGVYVARSGMDAAKVAAMMDKDTWIGGKEAIILGLADSLLAEGEARTQTDTKAMYARRQIESALAKQGVPRDTRTAMLSELLGARDAAGGDGPSGTRDAAGEHMIEALQGLHKLFSHKEIT